MRVFEKPNLANNWLCPVCGTNDEKEVVLVSVAGTQKGSLCQAEQVHLDCIELTLVRGHDGALYLAQIINKERGRR